MRVVVNQLVTAGLRTGVGHYTAQLVHALHTLTAPGTVGGTPPAVLRRLKKMWDRRTGVRTAAGVPGRSSLLRCWTLSLLRSAARALVRHYGWLAYTRRRYDVYHEPNFIPLPTELPTIATVHDLSALLHPEWHPPERVRHFEKHFRRGLERCQHFLAISESARLEIVRTLGIAPQRITCTYMGVRPGLGPLPAGEVRQTLKRLRLPPRYLLYLGTVEPRKNVLRLLRAYCALPAPLRQRWPLLLAGGWGWKTEEVADFYHAEARHKGVLHVGYVAEEHVAAVYSGARALVSPSLYEGFGMPPVEMLACGGAVLASRIGPHAETLGTHACLIDPEDTGGWHDALRRVLADDDWWHGLRQGAEEAARPFTWQRCAADTLRVYHAVAGSPVSDVAAPRRKAG